jgi:hypothetical protein
MRIVELRIVELRIVGIADCRLADWGLGIAGSRDSAHADSRMPIHDSPPVTRQSTITQSANRQSRNPPIGNHAIRQSTITQSANRQSSNPQSPIRTPPIRSRHSPFGNVTDSVFSL